MHALTMSTSTPSTKPVSILFKTIRLCEDRAQSEEVKKTIETDMIFVKQLFRTQLIQLDDTDLRRQQLMLSADPEAGLGQEDRRNRKAVRILTNFVEATGGHHLKGVSDGQQSIDQLIELYDSQISRPTLCGANSMML